MLDPQGLCAVVRAFKPIGLGDDFFTKSHPHFGRASPHGHIPILCAIGLVGCRASVPRPCGGGDFARAKKCPEFPRGPGQPSFQQRGFQVLAFAKTQLANQGTQNARQGRDAAGNVVHGNAHFGWAAARLSGHHHDAGHALGNDVVAAFLAIRPGLAKARHGRVNHTRVVRANALVVQPHALDHTGAEIFHHDVGFCSQLVGDLETGWVFQVQGNAFFVAVEHCKTIRLAIDLGLKLARGVAFVGVFEFDDIGPHVRQDHAAVRASQHIGQIQNTQFRQWQCHGRAFVNWLEIFSGQ